MIIQPTFTRASEAYRQNGMRVAANEPRYETGKYGQAVWIEEALPGIRDAELLTIPLAGLVTQGAGTVECWAKAVRRVDNNYQMPFAAWPFFYASMRFGSPNTAYLSRLDGADVQRTTADMGKLVDPTQWNHWLVTWNSERMWLYINGAVHGDTGVGTFKPVPASLYVGCLVNNHFWNGLIDDLRIYDETFDAERALLRYNGVGAL